MPKDTLPCPVCRSDHTRYREHRQDWFCDNCDHKWQADPVIPENQNKPPAATSVFISYGRRDAADLAARIAGDLRSRGHEVWIDKSGIRPGESWQHEIAEGLRSSRLVIALLSPHSVRTRNDDTSDDGIDSVCLSEIAFALFGQPHKPVIPVMGLPCEPPLAIYHFDYVDLTKWSESESQYQEGIERLLGYLGDTLLHRPPRYRSWYHFLQPWDFAAFLHEKRKGFTGRDWLFRQIDAWREREGGSRFLLVTGDPGVGKSAIVAHLVHHNACGQVIAYHCCQADTRATLEPWRFVRSIAAMLASRMDDYAKQVNSPAIREILAEERCRQDPGSALERGILAPLSSLAAPPGGVRYLLIDALDEALVGNPGNNIVDLLATRVERFPPWLRIVATTRKEPAVLRRLKGLPTREIRADDPSNIDDLKRFVRERLSNLGFSGSNGDGLEPGALEEIAKLLAEKSGGNFLYVTQALAGVADKLVERNGKPFDMEDFEALPHGLAGMYEQFFGRRFGSDSGGFAKARGLLEVVCAAKEPLSQQDLAAASGLANGNEFMEVWKTLAQFLPERSSTGKETVYRPFHKSLVDWLTSDETKKDSDFWIDELSGHARLADTGWEAGLSRPDGMGNYFLRHLPHHLAMAGRTDKLQSLLSDFDYIRRVVEGGHVFELVRHFIEAMPLLPPAAREAINPWFYFIRSNAGGLASRPACFFQTAFNEPLDSPVAERAAEVWNRQRERVDDDGATQPGPFKNEATFYEKINRPAKWQKPACLLTLQGHGDFVSAVSADPTGRVVVSGSDDGTVKVWDGVTGECRLTMSGHGGKVFAVAVSPDGEWAASGSEDRSVMVWDLETGHRSHVFPGHEGYVLGVAIGTGRQSVYSCSEDGTIRFWETADGSCSRVIKAHKDRVMCLRLSAGGDRLLSGSRDRGIALWDIASGNELLRVRDHGAMVFGVAISPDGSRLASVSQDGTLKIWNSANSGCERVIRCGTDYFYDVDFSPDGRSLVTVAYGGLVEVWDVSSGKRTKAFHGHSGHAVSVRWVAGTLISGARDSKVKLWDARSMDGGEPASGQTATPMALTLIDGNRTLAAGMTDETIRLWDTVGGSSLKSFRAHRSYVLALARTGEGTIVSGSYDELVRTWEPPFEAPRLSMAANQGYVFCLATSPDGRKIAAGHSRGLVRLWDGQTGECLGNLVGHTDSVLSVALDSSGNHCLTGSRDGTVRIWELQTWASRLALRHHAGEVRCVAFSPANDMAASGGSDSQVWLFNPRTGGSLHRLGAHSEGVSALSFLGDRYLVSGSKDRSIKIWDLRTNECLKTLEGHSGEITSIVVDPQGDRIFSASVDGTIRCWQGPAWTTSHLWFGNPNQVEEFRWYDTEGEFWMRRQDGSVEGAKLAGNGKILPEIRSLSKNPSLGKQLFPSFVSARGGPVYPSADRENLVIPGIFIQAFDLFQDGSLLVCVPESGGFELYIKK